MYDKLIYEGQELDAAYFKEIPLLGVAPTPSTVEPMLVTPSDYNISISSVSDLEIDWGDGTIQTVKSGDDTSLESLGLISNKYTHTYTDSYIDKTISIKHIDGESPIQFFSSDAIKTVNRWYSEGYQPFEFSNGSDLSLTFYGLGSLLETVPNAAPPNTTDLSGLFASTGLFNQDISGWDVSNVTGMRHMFEGASAFNQDLSSWCVTNITSSPEGFDDGATNWTLPRPVWGTCPSGEETASFEIADLFTNNEQGFFYDPNDLTTMFQDAVGTVPVTGVGQPVGLILDKSGRNNHAYQTTSASRPILRQDAVTGAYYLEFDGVDDSLQTNSINFTVTDKISVFAGQQTYLPSDAAVLVETGTNYTNPTGGFVIFAPATKSTELSAPTISAGVSGGGRVFPAGNFMSGNLKSTITLTADLSKTLKDEQLQLRVNGDRLYPTTNSTIVAGSSFANVPVYIGRREGTRYPFKGRIYGLICVGKLTSENETTTIEIELAKRVGVTLNV